MTISATEGPVINYGQQAPVAAGTTTAPSYNPDYGPSLSLGGTNTIDPRYGYKGGGGGGSLLALGWYGSSDNIVAINATPAALAANNIAASQVPVAGTALTLVSSTGAGVTVLAASTLAYPAMTTLAAGTLALDGAATVTTYGQTGPVGLYTNSTLLARNIRITTGADETGATFTIRGYDVYGYAMTETITGVNNGVAAGAKAWKYITSITPAGTLTGTAITVGTGDVFGLPIRSDMWGTVRVFWNSAAITASTGFTAAVTTTATATTGDVRGTYAVQSASDGTKTLQVYVTVRQSNGLFTPAALCGVAQF